MRRAGFRPPQRRLRRRREYLLRRADAAPGSGGSPGKPVFAERSWARRRQAVSSSTRRGPSR